MSKASTSYQIDLIERLRRDPDFQFEYIKASLEENSDMPDAIIIALRDVAEALGYEKLALDAHLSKKSLYKILSENKDSKPRYETIARIIEALGFQITIEPKRKIG